MIDRILPDRLDNNFRGYRAALWIFVVIALMKVALGLGHVVSPDGGAQSLTHIPLDSYPPGAAQNVVALFARLGLEQLLLGVLFVIVLVRYRAMIPLMYVVAVMGQFAALALAFLKPLSLAAPSSAWPVHLVLAGLGITGLVLSLMGSGYIKTGSEARQQLNRSPRRSFVREGPCEHIRR